MARRTTPKKQMEGFRFLGFRVVYDNVLVFKMSPGEKKGKGKVGIEPVETDKREDSDASEEISEETEASSQGDGEGSGDEEGSVEEGGSAESEEQGSESDDGRLAEVLNQVVKMAAALGGKKKRKEDKTPEDEPSVKPVQEEQSVKAANVVERSKELEVGQGSKRKLPEGAVVPKKKRMRKEGTKMKEVEGHGSPASLHYVIEHLSSAQRKDVEDIGFGGLLELKASKFIHTMVDWLLERYDTHTRLLLFNRFVHFSISKHDVYDVFMLPCEWEDVPTVTDDKDLVQCWRKRFGALPNKDIKLDQVVRVEMLKLVDGGPDFKRLFVLFAIGSFFAPTVHNRIDTRKRGQKHGGVPNVLPDSVLSPPDLEGFA
ncbi:uncharacterized protein LOC141590584 [Silene latifolia]|uniref:uncharacterized protein LOC141590584 n=1 Tax=Silene latifolia TaxID=37657 RepID=UPI003D76B838